MNDRTIEHRVSGVPLLVDLGPERVREFARLGSIRGFAARDVIFERHSEGDALYVVISGRVRVSARSADGEEVTLAVLEPGEPLGELSLLDGEPRSADATAMEPTEMLVVRRERFLGWLHEHPDVGGALLRTLSRRLRRTNEAYEDFAMLDVPQRVAKRVLALAEGRNANRITITQQDLATMLGVTREAVNKALRHHQSCGAIALGRGSITVTDESVLQTLAG